MTHKFDDQKETLLRAGHVKVTMGNGYRKVYLAEFDMKSNELHLIASDGKAIIYLSLCGNRKWYGKEQGIILLDVSTGIDYKFEPYKRQKQRKGYFGGVSLFVKESIINCTYLDAYHLKAKRRARFNARFNEKQPFDRFLLCLKRAAYLQRERIPKLNKISRKPEFCPKTGSLMVYNKFCNLLIDTRVKLHCVQINCMKNSRIHIMP